MLLRYMLKPQIGRTFSFELFTFLPHSKLNIQNFPPGSIPQTLRRVAWDRLTVLLHD